VTAAHFFVASIEGDPLRLEDDEGYHAARVLRLRPGEPLTLSDGRGNVAECEVSTVEPRAVTVHVRARRAAPERLPRIVVLPAVPKSGRLDLVVQKLTEIGVDEIRPWVAERSVVRWDERKRRAHAERWRAIAYEAAKQSRRAWLPSVAEPVDEPVLPPCTVALHEAGATRLEEVLPAQPPPEVGILIGPEGGLTDAEVRRVVSLGGAAAGLGTQILRAETAAIVGPALVMGRYRLIG
jgi:16S rRNA (uracil1498-N3)-methyltransferase